MTSTKKSETPITSAELARTPKTNEELRAQMANEVESFLAKGGSVEKIKKGLRVDVPKKPENKYGSRPI